MSPARLLSILLLLCVSTAPLCAAPQGKTQDNPHEAMAGFLVLKCWIDAGKDTVETKLGFSIGKDLKLDQEAKAPAGLPPIRLKQFMPRAKEDLKIVADETGKSGPALKLAIVGPTQSFERWLVAGDPRRSQLRSLIASWRYLHAKDEAEKKKLLEEYQNEFFLTAFVTISRKDGTDTQTMMVKEKETKTLEKLGCKVQILKFFPSFTLGEGNKPINQSPLFINPAVFVKIEHDGKSEERWVFTKMEGKHEKDTGLPFKLELQCRKEDSRARPDFALVTTGKDQHETWIRNRGTVVPSPLKKDQKAPVGRSQYKFHMAEFLPSALVHENYVSFNQFRGSKTVLQVEVAGKDGKARPYWLVMGQPRAVPTEQGTMTLLFDRSDQAKKVAPK